MTDKEIKKLSKSEIADLFAAKDNEINELRSQVMVLQRQLRTEIPATKSIGSIAEAALSVNGVFTAAQKAADEYLTAVMTMSQSTEKHCEEMIEQTKQYCDKLVSDTRYKCVSMENDAKKRSAELLCQAQEKTRTAVQSVTSALRDYYLKHEDKLLELPADLQRLIRSPH